MKVHFLKINTWVIFFAPKQNVLQLRDLHTGDLLKTYSLDVGTITEISSKRTRTEFFFNFTSFLTPGIIYRVDLSEASSVEPAVYRQIELQGFNPSQFETQQIFYASKDGTRIPMFIVKKKVNETKMCCTTFWRTNRRIWNFIGSQDLVNDGKNPCWMYGYGGFNIGIQPSFSVTRIAFMQHFSGVMAIPNIRGGGYLIGSASIFSYSFISFYLASMAKPGTMLVACSTSRTSLMTSTAPQSTWLPMATPIGRC